MGLANGIGIGIPFTVSTNVPALSYLFDGVDELFDTADDAIALTGTGGISISIWVKLVDVTTNAQFIFCKANGSTTAIRVQYNGSASSRKFQFNYRDGTGGYQSLLSATAGEYEDGEWHHVVCTTDCTTGTNAQKIYVDGSIDNQRTPTQAGFTDYTGTDSSFAIGAKSNNANNYNGYAMQAILFDDTNLSAGNVTTLYNSGFPAKDADVNALSPTAWWKLGNGDTFSTNWTCDDQVGTADMTSTNMEEADRTSDVP